MSKKGNQSPRDAFEARQGLYKLMKKAVFATGYGNEEEDYTETINLDIGKGTLSYDPYYDSLIYCDEDGSELEIGSDDLETVQDLIVEIKKRFKQFEKNVKASREKAARESFGKPIGEVIKKGLLC